jgi:ATP-dependent RNA helicase RhlE
MSVTRNRAGYSGGTHHSRNQRPNQNQRPEPDWSPSGGSDNRPSTGADNRAPAEQSGDCVFASLIPELSRAVAETGYTVPTPVQAQCIPHLLKGRDLLGSAQTGTGKTAAFTLPLLQYLAKNPRAKSPRHPRVLIMAPTRELAAQIGDSIKEYGRHLKLSHTVIFGGVGQRPQENAMNRGVDFLIATPGRLLDLMNQGYVKLQAVEAFVLDEADRMLDMGFINDVRKVIAKIPAKRQSLFFSATVSPEIVSLANTMLNNPVRVTIAPEQPTVEKIDQKIMFVDKRNKDDLLISMMRDSDIDKVIIFTQQKHVANKVAERLNNAGIRADAIHGNKSQGARTRALEGFRASKVRALVATDIAARGIDVDGITHVINYQLPIEPEIYVHRIGRTARAGAEGDAVSFCAADERDQLRAIERLIRKRIPVDDTHPHHSEMAANATGAEARPAPRGQRGQRSPRGGGGRDRDRPKATSPAEANRKSMPENRRNRDARPPRPQGRSMRSGTR